MRTKVYFNEELPNQNITLEDAMMLYYGGVAVTSIYKENNIIRYTYELWMIV